MIFRKKMSYHYIMAMQTRSMKKKSMKASKSKSAVRTYRKRVGASRCRKARSCRKVKGCKKTAAGKRKSYCRKSKNTRR